MKFFSLSLRRRLLLAIIPSFVLLLALVADVLIDGWFLWDEKMILLLIAYAALFGVFVMAPFITSSSRLILRIGVLIIASIFIPIPAILSAFWLEEIAFDPPLGIAYFVGTIFIILPPLLLAAVLAIAAPLKVSGKYWIYVALAAIVSTAVFFGSAYWFFCSAMLYMDGWSLICPWWWALAFVIPPSVVAPLSFCTAVYFGRIDSKRVEQITTESERQ